MSLGCARNDVDSEELAGRLAADGWTLVEEPEQADAVLVNTCGFIDAAKQESIATIIDLADDGAPAGRPVVAVGCLAERYGRDLAAELPEAAAVLGFDAYADIGARLRAVVGGAHLPSHAPVDRRTLLPITPVDRPPATAAPRRRLEAGPVAPLKIASGCDRRCAFCAIPAFRGAFVSRPPAEIVAEAAALVADGVREVVLVSENSTSYGKDLADPHALPALLRALDGVDGLDRIRVSYLQPAEVRPALVAAIVELPSVATYFDLPFQHAAPGLLRRMRRFGGHDDFLALIGRIRDHDQAAGIRSNVILGFPGETEDDVAVLHDFLAAARLDAIGVFGYSDEEGTEGATLPGKIDPDVIAGRVAATLDLVDTLIADRAAERVGASATVLVEGDDGDCWGRTQWQGPEDGRTTLATVTGVPRGRLVDVRITHTDGADLVAAVDSQRGRP